MNSCAKIGKPARPGRQLWRWALLLAVWTLLAPGSIFAQGSNPKVIAGLRDPVIDVGEATEYQISVVNGSADSPPPVPVVAGLTFQYIGEANSYKGFFDGRNTRSVSSLVYRYAVRALQPGRYVIPGQEVIVRGASFRTLPLTFTAEGSGAAGTTPPSRTVSAELIVPKKSVYVGESIPVEVRSYFGTEVHRRLDPDVVLEGDGFSVQKFTPPVSTEQVVDGSHYNVIFYKSAITALKIGNLTVGPAETDPIIQLPLQNSRHQRPNIYSQFGGILGEEPMQPPAQIKMRTEPLGLEVRSLPEGKPADFSGGIGQFKLDVEAEPRRVQAGDPVTVRLILSGQGNFDRIAPPALTDEHGLKVYPPNAKFKADDDVGLSGVKTFEQVVIADAARASLPAYHFNYLDPATGKYVSLDTPPVAVKIEGSVATPAPTPAVAQQVNPTPTATPTPAPPRVAEDILYIRPDPGATQDRAAFLPVYQRRSFWLAQGVPLAALLAAVAGLGLRARARNEAARSQSRRQREQAELQRSLRKENTGRRDFYLAATRLAGLRAARGRTDAPATAAEISQARQLDPQTADSVQEIFHRRDELTYSGGEVAREPVPAEERRRVLATLETLGK